MIALEKMVKALSEPLDPARVKKREGFDYIEGWHAIAEANRIFGYFAWVRETISNVCVATDKNTNNNNVVSYVAKVRITVHLEDMVVVREGTGFGNGINKDLGKCHESASKEAETDAMKRALMTFGNPFGLALYDKEKAGVGISEEKQQEEADKHQRGLDEKFSKSVVAALPNKKTSEELEESFGKVKDKMAYLMVSNKDIYNDLMAKILIRKNELLQQKEVI